MVSVVSNVIDLQTLAILVLLSRSSLQIKCKHEEKEMVIWEAFKERLGTSEFSCIHFNLDNLLKELEGLDEMVNLSARRKLTA
jgi:hypothetical protein